MIRSRRVVALAAVASLMVLGVGVGQAAAQGSARPRIRPAAASSSHTWSPLQLPWVRKAFAQARSHHARPADVTIGNFAVCPKIPKGFNPANTACFITHITGGLLQIGHTTQIINRNITIPYLEGVNPSGKTVIVPGVTQSAPMPVLGGLFETPEVNNLPIVQKDPNLHLAVQPMTVTVTADPTGATPAFISQKIKLINPVFGRTCTLGSNTAPIVFDPTFGTTKPPPPNQPISGHIDSGVAVGAENVLFGTLVDNSFAAPAAAGCGPSGSLSTIVNEVGGLASPAGTNTAIFQVEVEIVLYSNIH